MSVKQALLQGLKVAGSIVLQTVLPGSAGIIQQVEDLLGPKTGAEKKTLAVKMAMNVMETMAKAGKLDGAAPVLSEVEATVEKILIAMKATGQLIESKGGTLDLGKDGKFQIVIVGRIE